MPVCLNIIGLVLVVRYGAGHRAPAAWLGVHSTHAAHAPYCVSCLAVTTLPHVQRRRRSETGGVAAVRSRYKSELIRLGVPHLLTSTSRLVALASASSASRVLFRSEIRPNIAKLR